MKLISRLEERSMEAVTKQQEKQREKQKQAVSNMRPSEMAAEARRITKVQKREKEWQKSPAKPDIDRYIPEEKHISAGLYRTEKGENGKTRIYFDAPKEAKSEEFRQAGVSEWMEGRAENKTERIRNAELQGQKEGEELAGKQDKELKIGVQKQTEDAKSKKAWDISRKDAQDVEGMNREAEGSPEVPESEKKEESEKAESCRASTDKVDREIKKLKEKKKELKQQIEQEADETKIKELEKKLAQVERELRQKDNDGYRRRHVEFS